MPKIIVVGLGPWEKGFVTEKARQAMDKEYTVFRTEKHPEAEGFAGAAGHECLDRLYARAGDFEALNASLASAVMRLAGQRGTVVYAVPGQGATGDCSVTALASDGAKGSVDLDLVFAKSGLSEKELALELDRIREHNKQLQLLVEKERIRRFREQQRKVVELEAESKE